MTRWQTKAEGVRKGSLVVVFSHNHHRAELSFLLTQHYLLGERWLVVVDILHHNDHRSGTCLGA